MKPAPTSQKLRGGYYTPKAIGDFLARWAIQSLHSSILDPSCGDGGLLTSAAERLIECGVEPVRAISLVHGVEIDPVEAAQAFQQVSSLSDVHPPTEIHVGDFFSYCQEHLVTKRFFDVVIGNPPFIRYQNFPEQHRTIAFDLMRSAGLNPNRLTNAWVPFLVASTLLLSKNGRMAMIVPAELLQVNYAAELRYFLSEHYAAITLITFRKLVFEGIQQEVVLLLGEKNSKQQTGINVVELVDVDDLKSYETQLKVQSKVMDHSTEKWTMYFLEPQELELLRQLRSDPRLTLSGDVIDVDVGVVTGMNEFFVLPEWQLNDHSLQPFAQPIVGRSMYLEGSVFSESDWQTSVQKQASAFLLNLPNQSISLLPDTVKNYVLSGERAGIHTGYKCRIRKLWYVVPSIWIPDAFMLRQVHHYPKIVLNTASATSTDTIHRVRMRNGVNPRAITAAFLNSLTFAFSEITGRSYGGGVLELEPNEAECLPLPLIGADQLDLDEIDRLLRRNDIYAVLDITDGLLLRTHLGMSDQEVSMLRGIWEKLRDRRIHRKHNRSRK